MTKGRLEAFSDGVFAIIITIMVLEMKIPHGNALSSLQPVLPVFMSYIMSYIGIGIYWNNHHHMMQAVHHINGSVLWANIHLLFWLSLFPFVTGWMGENNFSTWPVALYGVVLFFAAIAYFVLARSLVNLHGKDSVLGIAIGKDWKGKISLIIYATGIALSFIYPWLGASMYVLVGAMWLIPDKRIESKL
ncbi:MAG TPA: TMEM175 family protein [Chitinophagaceae bacterium]|nr:TMEM175 family protein [Chitinophagaceae bacterium]